MKLEIPAFSSGSPVPEKHCFCVPATQGHVSMGENVSPLVRWSDLPKGTRSLTLLVVDPDVPSVATNVNQEDRTVPADLPRIDFYHWVLVDIPATIEEIPEGADSEGITARGKPVGKTDYGVRGINGYTAWFQGDTKMEGTYGGYDGPCPPWNDERLHHYHFRLYALRTESLKLDGPFDGADALATMKGKILAEAEHTGTYTLNPALR
jgi:hypothetical protein